MLRYFSTEYATLATEIANELSSALNQRWHVERPEEPTWSIQIAGPQDTMIRLFEARQADKMLIRASLPGDQYKYARDGDDLLI